MRIQNILAVTDFSRTAEQALDRAALLAAQHRCTLAVLYAAERADPNVHDPAVRLAQRAGQLTRRHGIEVHLLPLAEAGPAAIRAVLCAAKQADVLVLDARPASGWLARRAQRGGWLAQVLRASPCPVLVVQGPAGQPYAHVLVDAAHDACEGVLRRAGALEPRATLEWFHAARPQGVRSLRLQCGEAFARALRSRRQPQQAPRCAVHVSDAFEARRNRVGLATGGIDAVRQLAIQQQSTGADLVALVQPRRSALMAWLQPGAACRLLAGEDGVVCDVLVLPRGPAAVRGAGAGSVQSAVARRWTQAT